MPTKRSSFRLLAVIICFVAAVWMAAACQDAASYEEPCGPGPILPEEEGDLTTPSGTPTPEKIIEVRDKYQPLFRRQPNFALVSEGLFFHRNLDPVIDRKGNRVSGIIVTVDGDPVDQETLPQEDRIPDCLEGVPVQIVGSNLVLLGG